MTRCTSHVEKAVTEKRKRLWRSGSAPLRRTRRNVANDEGGGKKNESLRGRVDGQGGGGGGGGGLEPKRAQNDQLTSSDILWREMRVKGQAV